MNFQNRLRHSDYVRALKAAGYRLIREERNVDAPGLEALRTGRVKPAPRFQGYTLEDLATVDSFLFATK